MSELLFSNRYEVLAERLVGALGGARATIFHAEQVIVPSAALQRDLSLRIADRHGVCAQVEFSFLAQWLWRQIARRVPQVGADSPFAPPVLAWRIDRLLGDASLAAAHPRLAAYLGAADAVMRFGIATRLAGLFDHYITYRSDWLLRWADGGAIGAPAGRDAALWQADQAWQGALWRRLVDELQIDGAHPVQKFIQALEDGTVVDADPLPGSLHVMCLPAIPPLYLQALQAIGRHTDLRLYLINPCREYWFDLVDPRRLSHLAAQGRAQHAEVGNPLLSGWGQQTQAQIDLLLDSAASTALPDDADFVEAAGGHLLARLQNAVLDGVGLSPGSVALAPADRSIEVHVCHSMTRELEVLHDHLLGLFGSMGAGGEEPLQPHQVLVVTPDLEAAAPLIDAVFGTAPPERHIAFAITGRPRRSINRSARALSDLLALLASRCPASAVFELLQQPLVSRRFGLDAAALEQVQQWMTDAGIRWGLDDGTTADSDAPSASRHSLMAGLQRLFLAHALPGRVDQTFAGELPAGSVDGQEALALGAFWRFAETLRGWQQPLGRANTPRRWLALLLEVIDGLLLAQLPDELDEVRELRASLHSLTVQMAAGGLTEAAGDEVAPEVLRTAVAALLEEPTRGGVPTGRVSFAAMSSLRSLPFRVVCVVGLNDGAFPSPVRPLEFDLMAQQPRRGDRQRRNDERNTFLDLLLAARDSLYLSHTGRSVRDNATLPPSVLVSELLDLLLPAIVDTRDGTTPDAAALAAARRRLVVEHPLQAFSPLAFAVDGDPRLRSHQRDYADALMASQRAAAPPAFGVTAPFEVESEEDEDPEVDRAPPQAALVFFNRPLPPPGAEWRSPDLDTLMSFFYNPCRALLEQRLRLRLPRQEEELADDEAFVPDYEGRNVLAARVLPAVLAGAGAEQLAALAAASVQQPGGTLGSVAQTQELTLMRNYAARLAPALASPALPPHHFVLQRELDGERWQIDIALAELRAGGLIHHRYDDARVADRLRAWLWHLALCACAPADVAQVSTWHARDGVFSLRPCDDAVAQLDGLLRLYRQGLREPLHFFHRASWAYAETRIKRDSREAGLTAARGKWLVSPFYRHGEAADPAYRLALRGRPDPLDAAFEANSMQVLAPLLAHLVENAAEEVVT